MSDYITAPSLETVSSSVSFSGSERSSSFDDFKARLNGQGNKKRGRPRSGVPKVIIPEGSTPKNAGQVDTLSMEDGDESQSSMDTTGSEVSGRYWLV